MKNLSILGIVSGLAGLAAVAATPAVKDAFAPATDGAVHLAGRAGESADACIRARAYSDWARGAMYEECVNAFRTHWDDRVGWQNEYWGKTMLCYAGAAMYTGDPALKAWIVEKTHAFLKEFQKPNGYLSTYSKEDFLRNHPEDPDAKKHWCFNIWGRKYTFWALIDIYRATGDKASLDGAVKMADHLIAQLKRLGLTLDKTGAWNGISSMSILRPMLELYHITGNPAYLALCKDIVRAMDAEPANPGRIIRDAFRKEKICTWYPEAAFWAKAYETQSCLEGLVDYYRTTGEKRVLDAVLAYHKHLMDEELNPMRSAGYFDHFLDARHHVNGMTELCDVTHWIRLNRELLLLTGDAKYADIIEEAFYNAFLAGVSPDGAWGAHIVRSHGTRHLSAPAQTGMKLHQCCPDNMLRTFYDWADTVADVANDGAWEVNFYSDADIALPGAKIEVRGNYPVSESFRLRVVAERGGRLRLRVPCWAKEMSVDGVSLAPVNGRVEVHVAAGENSFGLALKMPPRVIDSEAPDFEDIDTVTDLDTMKPEGYTKRFMSWYTPEMKGLERRVPAAQVMRGPLVLAKGRLAGTSRAETFEFKTINRQSGWKTSLSPAKRTAENAAAWGAWELSLEKDGERRLIPVADFWSVSNVDDPSNWFSLWF